MSARYLPESNLFQEVNMLRQQLAVALCQGPNLIALEPPAA